MSLFCQDGVARPNKKIVFADSDEGTGSSDNEGTSLTDPDKRTQSEDKVSQGMVCINVAKCDLVQYVETVFHLS